MQTIFMHCTGLGTVTYACHTPPCHVHLRLHVQDNLVITKAVI